LPRSGAPWPVAATETQQEILVIDARARAIARTMLVEENREQVELAVGSTDRVHRIAAAFYFQFRLDPDPCLMSLLADPDPLVVEAARLALVIIANDRKFRSGAYPKNHLIDFGPWMDLGRGGNGPGGLQGDGQVNGLAARRDAIDLWESHFDRVRRKAAGGQPAQPADRGAAK
jgi:hypothetical protein